MNNYYSKTQTYYLESSHQCTNFPFLWGLLEVINSGNAAYQRATYKDSIAIRTYNLASEGWTDWLKIQLTTV